MAMTEPSHGRQFAELKGGAHADHRIERSRKDGCHAVDAESA
jgi:hypothetical protein